MGGGGGRRGSGRARLSGGGGSAPDDVGITLSLCPRRVAGVREELRPLVGHLPRWTACPARRCWQVHFEDLKRDWPSWAYCGLLVWKVRRPAKQRESQKDGTKRSGLRKLEYDNSLHGDMQRTTPGPHQDGGRGVRGGTSRGVPGRLLPQMMDDQTGQGRAVRRGRHRALRAPGEPHLARPFPVCRDHPLGLALPKASFPHDEGGSREEMVQAPPTNPQPPPPLGDGGAASLGVPAPDPALFPWP